MSYPVDKQSSYCPSMQKCWLTSSILQATVGAWEGPESHRLPGELLGVYTVRSSVGPTAVAPCKHPS